ncbi:MAG TPA: hypothetical protein VLK78_05260 [Candidatus Angelobacter sp.]|nr:hypothetical protein [Candidatus Angelobacter sp.]
MDNVRVKVNQITFEREEPFPNERKGEVFAMVNEIMDYAITNYEEWIVRNLETNLDALSIPERRELEFKHHLFWWIVYCLPLRHEKTTIFHEFIQQNWTKWKHDHTLLQVLFSWAFIAPSYYEVIEVTGERDLIIRELIGQQTKKVTVYSEFYTPPEPGDLLSGLLLSFCDHTYSPIFDFLKIPKNLAPLFSQKLLINYSSKNERTPTDFFQKYYGFLIAAMLPYLSTSNY